MRISDWSSDVCSSDLMSVRPSGNELGDNGFGAIMDLNGMAAVITGGESGIGAASAIQIANAGAAVTITYLRDRTAAQAIVDAIKQAGERKSVVEGKRVSVRVDLGGRRIVKKKQKQ